MALDPTERTSRYRWWTVLAWWNHREVGVKLGPISVSLWKTLDHRWVPGVYVLNGRWFWERW